MSKFRMKIRDIKTIKKPIVIVQDLEFDVFLIHVKDLVDKVIYPRWFQQKSCFFISFLPRDLYQNIRIKSNLIHEDLNKALDLLALEQMMSLLEKPRSIILDKPNHEFLDLNDDQRIAVNHGDGPMRVLAPAGSGKTMTLVHRIANLVYKGVAEEDILALAFNKKAQLEMKERLETQFDLRHVEVLTFHSFGYRILQDSLGWVFRPQQERVQTRHILARSIQEFYELQGQRNIDVLDDYMTMLSRSKNELLNYQSMTMEIDEETINFAQIFTAYIHKTAQQEFINFDDMVYLAVRKLLSDHRLRKTMQNKYRYLLVDEFQDLNRGQLLMVEILMKPMLNVFVTGDDDQLIYSFRGANTATILDFNQKNFVHKDQILKTNYRSNKKIVNQSKWLIDHNKNRVYKDIKSQRNDDVDIQLEIGKSLKDQGIAIANWILALKEKNQRWDEFAVLVRYNQYRDLLALILEKHQIPTNHRQTNLFNSVVGKTTQAYLNLLCRKDKVTQNDYQRVLKTPNKYLSNEFIDQVIHHDEIYKPKKALGYLNQSSLKRYQEFIDKIKDFKLDHDKPASVLNQIINTFDLRSHFTAISDKSSDYELTTAIEVLEIIVNFAEVFDTMEAFYKYLDTLQTRKEIKTKNVVMLSTIHRTKGNEFSKVAYFNLDNRPTKDLKNDQLEEERRVSYVGITRAQDRLFITSQDKNLSPFIREIFMNPKFKGVSKNDLKLRLNHEDNKAEIKLIKNELKIRSLILRSLSQ